jgi:MFS family permease
MTDLRWLLQICLARTGFAVINISCSALIPVLRPAWNMTASQAGLVQSAWHGGYIVSLVLASQLSGRFGAKRTFIGMGYAASASALVFALGARDFLSAFVLYGLAGLCAGGSYVPGLTLIAERFPPAQRGRAMGAYIAAASLGYALGLPGTVWLATGFGESHIALGLLLGALGATLGLGIAIPTLRHSKNIVIFPVDRSTEGRSILFSGTSLRWLWRDKPARWVMLAYGFHAWELLGMWAWLPAYLSAAAHGHGEGGLLAGGVFAGASLAALSHLVSTAGSLAGGSWSDRWGRQRVILALSLASIACSLLFGWLFALPLWLLVAVALVYNFTAIGDSAIHSAVLTEVVPPEHLPTAYSLRSVLGFGMGAISPWVFGVVLDRLNDRPELAWGSAWSMLGIVALAGPYATWRLLNHHCHQASRSA